MEKAAKTISTDDILLMLCNSVRKVLSTAIRNQVNYSPMVQRISRTCLRPDIGCFVIFDGVFSGLVLANFSAQSAMELYRGYMISMGMPESELASQHTSEDVGNMLGELINQIVGDFTSQVGSELLVTINQNQPKMLTINKEVLVSIDTNLDNPQARRVSFTTPQRNVFYIEFAMDQTEFIKLHEFEREVVDPDRIVDEARGHSSELPDESQSAASIATTDDDLLKELGL